MAEEAAIYAAVNNGDVGAVAAYMGNVNTKFENISLLNTAILSTKSTYPNKLEIVRILLTKGADPNFGGKTGKYTIAKSPLAVAASLDEDGSIVNTLLDAGADINGPGFPSAPIWFAASKPNYRTFTILVLRGANIIGGNASARGDIIDVVKSKIGSATPIEKEHIKRIVTIAVAAHPPFRAKVLPDIRLFGFPTQDNFDSVVGTVISAVSAYRSTASVSELAAAFEHMNVAAGAGEDPVNVDEGQPGNPMPPAGGRRRKTQRRRARRSRRVRRTLGRRRRV